MIYREKKNCLRTFDNFSDILQKKELLRKVEVSNRALQNFAHGPGGVKPDPDNDATAAAANEARDNEIGELKAEIEALAKKNEGEHIFAIFSSRHVIFFRRKRRQKG